MLRAADIMKPAGAFRAARVGFFGAAALDRQGIDRNGGFDMVFYFSGTGNSKYAARRARASAQNGAACTGCIHVVYENDEFECLCLGAACTGCILMQNKIGMVDYLLCLGAACTGCIGKS